MHLLWLKIHSSALEDAPAAPPPRLDSRSRRQAGAAALERAAAAGEGPRPWNVKSVPRTVAPWTEPEPGGTDAPAERHDDDEETLVPVRLAASRAARKAAGS